MTVAYDSAAVLPDLAADLARQSRPPRAWLVVDNSPLSAPVSAACLASAALPLRRLTGVEGEGFGAGCNQALDLLEAEGWCGWVWLLNPDTSLPKGNELAALQEALSVLPPTAVVGTAVDDGNGGLEASGGWVDAGLHFRRRCLRAEHLRRHPPLAVDWLSGCNLALQPTSHEPPARFDPGFPLYYEDFDLCLRLGRAGAPVLWLAQPRVMHRRGTGSGAAGPRRLRLASLGYLRFLRRHCPFWVFTLRSARLLLLNLLRLPMRPRRSGAALGALGTVWVESLRGLPAGGR